MNGFLKLIVGAVVLIGAALLAAFLFGDGGIGEESSGESSVIVTVSVPDTTQSTSTGPAPDSAAETTTLPPETTAAETTEAVTPTAIVTVSENDYFYQNTRISLDDLLAALEKLPAETAVKVLDDNASYKAYSALLRSLDAAGRAYLEDAAE